MLFHRKKKKSNSIKENINIVQDEENFLLINGNLSKGYFVKELWLKLRNDDKEIRVGTNEAVNENFYFKVDLYNLMKRLASSYDESNYDWYLKIRVPTERVSDTALAKLKEKADLIEENGVNYAEYLIRFGRFLHTNIKGFNYIYNYDTKAICYLTKKGNLSIAFNKEPFIPPIIHIEKLKTAHDKLSVEGKIFTKGSKIIQSKLIIKGRDSKAELETSVSFIWNEEETSLKYGLNRYNYKTEINFNKILDGTNLKEDVYDLFLKIQFHDQSEEKYVRVGRPKLKAKMFIKEIYSTIGNNVSIITPYYTFKGFNLSLEVFEFDKQTFHYLQKKLKTAWIERLFNKHKDIWIIGERPYKAQDTGYHFFKYMRENHPNKNAFYVIEKDSPERGNVEHLGNILDFKSKEHIWHVLMATRIIGSHHPDYLYPIRSRRFKRAVKGVKVFLQHGVMGTKNMIANYGKKTSGFHTDAFLVSSDFEKEMIVNDFGYNPKEVFVTGLSRFDRLLANDVKVKRQLLIIPTWRDWITTDEAFLESEYFERYKELVYSPDLHAIADKNDLEMILCLHPNMQKFSYHFQGAPVRVINQGEVDVQYLLKESAIMITDYSSVGFDFSFLYKPIIYYQFDRNRFIGKRPSHLDLENDLPGDIVTNLEDILDRLHYYAENHYKMSPRNKQRADKFLKYRDLNFSKRIYDVVKSLPIKKTLMEKLMDNDLVIKFANRFRKTRYYFPVMKRFYKLAKKLLPVEKNLILFESGVGKQYADSPRVIYEEITKQNLPYKKVWVINKNIRFKDPKTIKIKRLSPQYYYYLAKAGYWINNQNFPTYIQKRKETTYIQTWHGTPLKKMLFDIEHVQGRDEGYLDRVYNATQTWDYLISPSEYATNAFKSAFKYEGNILEIGYPRNDLFYQEGQEEIISKVKNRLKLPPNKKFILYAPTFRDNETSSNNKFVFNINMDLDKLKEKFGDEYILLLRMHVVISNKLSIPEELKDFVKNVSNYSDIQELLLISNILMTDYSSVMFDFANTGKPILFYTYDLETYKNDVRGFYMDFEKEAPGPFLFNTENIIEAIENIEKVKVEYKGKYEAFREKYCSLEDGKAAERLVNQFFK
ncbi:CDP-glycerol glycerophosphotransferase family protein [Neobacillus mesonae]|uniref:CDP-glycerol glycerophosphotransferase family protein n=1 Tax=Neobacillus mesonae TaxID=1193713 RepID=UPI00203F2097|nr:CDP-glycerol glycerophosphotransferase family protein [Neobacillus mesonae]MCM3567385.1 CDP-glycerol glycerophosphotransferase family protein [Neobacillus mesonae]